MSSELFARPAARAAAELTDAQKGGERRRKLFADLRHNRPDRSGPVNYLSGALPVIEPTPVAKAEAPQLHPDVAPIAGTLPIQAAELLSMVAQRHDETGKPVAFDREQVAQHFKLSAPQADAVVDLLIRRGLMVENRNTFGSVAGYMPALRR